MAVTDAASPTCADQVGSCPARSIAIWQVLLDPMDFGADARLVAIGGQAVLVALGDGTFRVVRLRNPFDNASAVPPYSSWEFPSSGLQPIAITEGRVSDLAPPPPNMLIVLACDQARTQCSMWRSDVSQSGLTPWQGTQLPSGFLPRGVELDTAVEPRAICVYGNGILCFQDDWQQAITPSPDLRLNAVAFGTLWSLAVGDHGRWFKRERDASGALGAWQEQAPLGDAALTQVSVQDAGGVITGEGRIQAVIGAQAEFFACSGPNDIIALMLNPGARGLAYIVTSTGEVLQHALVTPQRSEPYCAYQRLALPGVVLKTGSAPCSAALNPRVLTERALFGSNFCITL